MPPRDDEVQALVEQLSADLDRSVLVDDASLRLLAYSPTLGSEDEVRKTAILTRETPRVIRDLHFAQGIATATQPVRTAPRPDIGLESRVCVPIRCQGALFGYLWLIDADQSLTDADCDGGRADARPRSGRRCTAATNSRSRSGSSRCGCSRRCSATTPRQRDAAAHELPPATCWSPARRSACSRCAGRAGPGARARRRRARAAGARAGPVPPHAAAPPRAQHRPRRPRRADRGADRARAASPTSRAARRTRSTRRSPRRHAVIGYSDLCEHLRDAHRAHEHARLALRVAAALPEHGSPAGWEDLGAYRLLARAAETPHAQELIHPGLPKLFALHSKESLVQTLEAYLDNGCDTKLTAEALFLHRASLYYRLQRIEAITSTSLKSGADRLALHSGSSWRGWWAYIRR